MAVNSPAIPVRYGEGFQRDCSLRLLEVDDALLQELLHSSRLSIKGNPEEEAVLCSSTKTYSIKFVSTSNTMLLIPPSGDEEVKELNVVAAAPGHLELTEIAPRIDKLRELVSLKPFIEEEEEENTGEDDDHPGLCSWDELLENVQASENQLKLALESLSAVELRGLWRIVDPSYMQRLLEIILLTSTQNDWSLNSLPLESLVSAVEADGFPGELVRHCIKTFAAEEDHPGNTSTLWKLDENRVCVHYAKQLLSGSGKWKLDDFIHRWKQALPPEMNPEINMLRGEALITRLGSDSWLHQFSSSALPLNPADRFAALFKERLKWDWDDLEPYLRDLRIPGQTVESMLLKFTRKIQPTGDSPPVYTPR